MLHVFRIDRLSGTGGHEYLYRLVRVPVRPFVKADSSLSICDNLPALSGLKKFWMSRLPIVIGLMRNAKEFSNLLVGQAKHRKLVGLVRILIRIFRWAPCGHAHSLGIFTRRRQETPRSHDRGQFGET